MKSSISTFTIFTILITLTSCASIYTIRDSIPGLDRIINSFSKAEVGPVKDANGDVIQETLAQSDFIDLYDEIDNAKTDTLPVTIPEGKLKKEELNPTVTPLPTKAPEVKPKRKVVVAEAKVSGTIKLKTQQGFISPEGIILRLKRADGAPLNQRTKLDVPIAHNIDMEDKVYEPGNIVIRKGDAVNFVNKDEIQHNVFSSSGENAFDLGTFGSGLQRTVKLNEEGVVKVYCNIHPGMATYVAVDDVGISQIVEDEEGTFEFDELRTGEYILTLWSIRGTQEEHFSLENNSSLTFNLIFDTSNYQAPKRTDKYGKPVKKRKVRREFY